ncbi:unnamed protein product [Rotaria sordida]|uniref:PiggyBac transposable element-derived protein domain-containing protein n=1 Tax=Rotaria sordida TaxID=392033 RepID=A0A818NCS0_9BILA|nr:unnamed protein product [Rotaria sordida]
MAYSNTSDSDVTETFTDSELDDEIDTGSVSDSDNESDSGDEEQNKEEFFEERRWKEEWFEPKTFTFDSSESGISSYIPKNDENRPVDYFRLIFDHTLMQKIVQETNKYYFYTIRHEKLPERYQKAIDATEPEMSTGACGPVRVNRVGLPQFEDKISSGQQVYKSTDNMLALKWYDKREVTILSTIHQPQMRFTGKNNPKTKQPIRKPISIIDYNSKRGAIDKVYMQTSFVECIRKSVKWYRKLFFHMLDLLVFNTYLLYKMKIGERPQLVDFRLQLIREILQTYHTLKPIIGRSVHGCKPTRLTGRHFPTIVPQTTERKNSQRKCFVCANTNRKPRTRTDSRYMCKDCDHEDDC